MPSPRAFVVPVAVEKKRKKKCPQLLTVLEELLRDTVAGDPLSGLKWTHKSIRKLSKALQRRRLPCGHELVARLLYDQHFSLRTNRKRLAKTHDPERDHQFRYLARVRRWYLRRGLPVISVDAKKKEWVGNFKNPGRCWRRDSRAVLDHDFPRWAVGPGIPYGIYDSGRNAGYVVSVDRGLERGHFRGVEAGQAELPTDPDLQPFSRTQTPFA